MRHRSAWLASTLLLSLIGDARGMQTETDLDLVITGGKIVTLDSMTGGSVKLLGIKSGRIASLSESETPPPPFRIGPDTRVIRLKDELVIPGFIDSHAHLGGLGAQRRQIDLVGTASYEEVVRRVAERTKAAEKGRFVIGRGWDQNDWSEKAFPTHERLSRATPDHPVLLTRIDGHACLVNAAAMRLAGLTKDSAAPPGGEILKDGAGEPTGVLVDDAMDLMTKVLPREDARTREEDFLAGIDECLENGVTTFHDAGEGRLELEVLRGLAREGKLKIRLYVMISGSDSGLVTERFQAGPEVGLAEGRLTVRSVKLYADGALGSRGAALLEDYADRPGHRGLTLMSKEEIRSFAKRALDAGFQVAVHAIGDRGNREVIDAFEAAFAGEPRGRAARFRIEHAQILDEKDMPRMKDLGLIAAMQGVHCTSDMPWVPDRIGNDRSIEGAYAWRKLLDLGVVVANGTDAPVEKISPIECFYASVTRMDKSGKPEGGWIPGARMSREEALRSYTLAGAFAAFEEDAKGTLSEGKLADITILDRDILTCPAPEILKARTLFTIVGGRVEFERR
jgi:hypothetical protein